MGLHHKSPSAAGETAMLPLLPPAEFVGEPEQ